MTQTDRFLVGGAIMALAYLWWISHNGAGNGDPGLSNVYIPGQVPGTGYLIGGTEVVNYK